MVDTTGGVVELVACLYVAEQLAGSGALVKLNLVELLLGKLIEKPL